MNQWKDKSDLFVHFDMQSKDDMKGLSRHFNWNDLKVSIIEDNDVVAVSMRLVTGFNDFDPIFVTGSARREPGDKFDREVGLNLAMGRAFVRLGEKLVKRGMGKSNHNDWVKNTKSKLNKNRFSGDSTVNSIAAAVGYVFKK